jgi:hypothetical protein
MTISTDVWGVCEHRHSSELKLAPSRAVLYISCHALSESVAGSAAVVINVHGLEVMLAVHVTVQVIQASNTHGSSSCSTAWLDSAAMHRIQAKLP